MKYIDLALPSGTKWAKENSADCTMHGLPDRQVPSSEQFFELFRFCTHGILIDEHGNTSIVFTGKNGKSISLPLCGYHVPIFKVGVERGFDTPREYESKNNKIGYYRTSESKDFHNWIVKILEDGSLIYTSGENTYKYSVRLVQTKRRAK